MTEYTTLTYNNNTFDIYPTLAILIYKNGSTMGKEVPSIGQHEKAFQYLRTTVKGHNEPTVEVHWAKDFSIVFVIKGQITDNQKEVIKEMIKKTPQNMSCELAYKQKIDNKEKMSIIKGKNEILNYLGFNIIVDYWQRICHIFPEINYMDDDAINNLLNTLNISYDELLEPTNETYIKFDYYVKNKPKSLKKKKSKY